LVQEPRQATNGSIVGSLLVRELERQSILIAARDELGLHTRDMALGEVPADGEAGATTLLAGTQFWRAAAIDTILALPDDSPATTWQEFPKLDMTRYVPQAGPNILVRSHVDVPKTPWMDYAQ